MRLKKYKQNKKISPDTEVKGGVTQSLKEAGHRSAVLEAWPGESALGGRCSLLRM